MLTDNLTEYYKLDDNSNDATATANNGTDTNITYSAANGKINDGAGFNGVSSKIVLGTAIGMPTDLSVQAWAKSTTGVKMAIFGDTKADQSILWVMNVRSDGKLQFFWQTDAANYRDYRTDNVVISDANFHHIVFTQTGTGAPTIYVDGSSVASSLFDSLGAATKPSAQGSAIGVNGAAATDNFNGALDEVGIWTRALSAAEVTQLYSGGSGLAYPFTGSATHSSLLLGS